MTHLVERIVWGSELALQWYKDRGSLTTQAAELTGMVVSRREEWLIIFLGPWCRDLEKLRGKLLDTWDGRFLCYELWATFNRLGSSLTAG